MICRTCLQVSVVPACLIDRAVVHMACTTSYSTCAAASPCPEEGLLSPGKAPDRTAILLSGGYTATNEHRRSAGRIILYHHRVHKCTKLTGCAIRVAGHYKRRLTKFWHQVDAVLRLAKLSWLSTALPLALAV